MLVKQDGRHRLHSELWKPKEGIGGKKKIRIFQKIKNVMNRLKLVYHPAPFSVPMAFSFETQR